MEQEINDRISRYDEYYPISILRISPYNLPDESCLHMPLQPYEDGSWKTDNPERRFVTLTGVIANEGLWPQVESEWKAVLDSENVQYLHMTDLMAFKGIFSRDNGGKEERRENFIQKLFKVVRKFTAEKCLRVYSCCVALADYERAQKDIPRLRHKKVEALCVDHCVGGLKFLLDDFDVPRPITLYFDRKEKFLTTVEQVWTRARGRGLRPRPGWPQQVANILPVSDAREGYAIQVADLFAWIVNSKHASGDYVDLYLQAVFLHHRRWVYNYDKLRETYSK